jgi:hypothetical protein
MGNSQTIELIVNMNNSYLLELILLRIHVVNMTLKEHSFSSLHHDVSY